MVIAMAIGYVIVNDEHLARPIVCDEESIVYRDRLTAEKEARALRREHKNNGIHVYELAEPGILYSLSEEDVYEIAKQKRIGKKKVAKRMDRIQKGIEDGLSNWYEIVEDAIDSAIEG